MDKYLSPFFPRFAVRLAAMVDPARLVAVDAAVDQLAALQTEKESMERIVRIGTGPLVRLSLRDAFAFVFDDEFAGRNFAGGEYAVSVDGRMTDDDGRTDLAGCGWFGTSHEVMPERMK